jgi:hypothetical protein
MTQRLFCRNGSRSGTPSKDVTISWRLVIRSVWPVPCAPIWPLSEVIYTHGGIFAFVILLHLVSLGICHTELSPPVLTWTIDPGESNKPSYSPLESDIEFLLDQGNQTQFKEAS